MSLRRYKCRQCKKTEYVFDGEESRLSDGHEFEKLPNNPIIVHATNTFMSDPQLDSLKTIYDLDKTLTKEVRDEKEMKLFNEHRKNQ